MFRDGDEDEDKILSLKVGEAGTEKHFSPCPLYIYIHIYDLYIYTYIILLLNIVFKHFC